MPSEQSLWLCSGCTASLAQRNRRFCRVLTVRWRTESALVRGCVRYRPQRACRCAVSTVFPGVHEAHLPVFNFSWMTRSSSSSTGVGVPGLTRFFLWFGLDAAAAEGESLVRLATRVAAGAPGGSSLSSCVAESSSAALVVEPWSPSTSCAVCSSKPSSAVAFVNAFALSCDQPCLFPVRCRSHLDSNVQVHSHLPPRASCCPQTRLSLNGHC